MLRRILPIVVACAAPGVVQAQSILDIGARLAPQFHQYTIDGPTNTKISEFAVPLFVIVPVTPMFSLDVGSSYARSQVDQTINGVKTTSTISGLTDTQIRGNLSIGTDFIIITGGVNLPTGASTIPAAKQAAAGLIGSDFLAFPISTMGSGFGGTGGVAVAQSLGDWNLGIGLSARHSAQYDPFDASGGVALHYQPGNEYRGRVGLDHALGTGRFTIGVIYSTFGDDNLAGSVYNTGNRIISQLGLNDTFGPGQISITGWDLFRNSGTLANPSSIGPSSTSVGKENIGNGALAYAIPMGGATLEPNIEGRVWTQDGASASTLATFGLRVALNVGGFSVLPGVGYSIGQIAATDAAGNNTTQSLTGLHAVLAIRLR